MRLISFFLLISLTVVVPAYSQVSIKIDTKDYTQDEKNMVKALAYKIASDAGDNVVPKIVQTNESEITIIFDNLKNDTVDLITTENIKKIYAEELVKQEQAKQEEETKRAELIGSIRSKLIKNEAFTDEEVDFLFISVGIADIQ